MYLRFSSVCRHLPAIDYRPLYCLCSHHQYNHCLNFNETKTHRSIQVNLNKHKVNRPLIIYIQNQTQKKCKTIHVIPYMSNVNQRFILVHGVQTRKNRDMCPCIRQFSDTIHQTSTLRNPHLKITRHSSHQWWAGPMLHLTTKQKTEQLPVNTMLTDLLYSYRTDCYAFLKILLFQNAIYYVIFNILFKMRLLFSGNIISKQHIANELTANLMCKPGLKRLLTIGI